MSTLNPDCCKKDEICTWRAIMYRKDNSDQLEFEAKLRVMLSLARRYR